jgi:hypothetical protein
MSTRDLSGGLAPDEDLFLAGPHSFPWVREGTSYWLYEENGEFAIPRVGVDAEPKSWENRRFQANFAFPGGRVLAGGGAGPGHPTVGSDGVPSILGAGPMSFRCIEPFKKWRVSFDGEVVDTTAAQQIAREVDASRRIPLRYEIELEPVVPAFLQDVNPADFTTWGKGEQRDALSVGLGMRFEQLARPGRARSAAPRRRLCGHLPGPASSAEPPSGAAEPPGPAGPGPRAGLAGAAVQAGRSAAGLSRANFTPLIGCRTTSATPMLSFPPPTGRLPWLATLPSPRKTPTTTIRPWSISPDTARRVRRKRRPSAAPRHPRTSRCWAAARGLA